MVGFCFRGIAVLAVLCSLSLPAFSEDWKPFEGEAQPITTSDLRLELDSYKDVRFYQEEYSINLHPAGDEPFTIGLGVSNMGTNPGNGFVRGSINLGKGKKWKLSKSLKSGKWSQAPEKFQLDMGQVTLSGTPDNLLLKAETKEIKAEFYLKSGPSGVFRPGNGQVTFGPGEVFKIMVWPRCDLKGSVIRKKDGMEWIVKGVAVVTHSVTTISPMLHPRFWLHFKAVKKDHTVLVQAFMPPEAFGSELKGWALVANDQGLVAGTHELVFSPGDFRDDDGAKVPWMLHFKGKDLEGAVQARKLNSKVDELKKLSPLERAVVSGFVKPITWAFRAFYELKASTGGKSITYKSGGLYRVNKVK